MCPRSKAALSRRSRTAWGAADCISRASSPGAISVSAHLAFAAGTAQAGKDAMPFPEALRALNHRDFRFFWGGQLVSLIGTWMQSVAQSWLVLQLSGSPLKLGLIGTFQFAPVLMFSVVAGAIVDRLPKRRLILATQSALALQAFTITALVWSGHVQYWHVADRAGPRPRAGRKSLRLQLHDRRPPRRAEGARAGRRGVRLPHGSARDRRRHGGAVPGDPRRPPDPAPHDPPRGRPLLPGARGARDRRRLPHGRRAPLPARLLLDRLHGKLQHHAAALRTRRAPRSRDELLHARLRRRVPARRVHDRRDRRGAGGSDGPRRGRERGARRHGRGRSRVGVYTYAGPSMTGCSTRKSSSTSTPRPGFSGGATQPFVSSV